MGLTKLGNYIEQSLETNKNLNLTADFAAGMTITKEVIPTKANLSGTDLTDFLIVKPHYFIMNPRTHGKYIGLGFNNTDNTLIISWNNIAFKVKDENVLHPTFLFIMLRRPEWDRWATKNSWGTSTEVFTFETLCSYEFYLPPIEIQRKYVAIYEGLLANLHSYENKLEELKLVCDGYIEDLRKKYPSKEIGQYLKLTTEKNIDDEYQDIVGISNTQKLVPSDSRTNGVDTSKYLILKPGDFAYSPIHINDGSVALNMTDNTYIISPIYATFRTDEEYLHNEYLMLCFARNEFVRYCWFHAFGTARDTFEWEQMKKVEIPIPPLEIQNSIVEVFNVYNERKEYVNRLKNIIKDICPLLVRGAIKEASEVK